MWGLCHMLLIVRACERSTLLAIGRSSLWLQIQRIVLWALFLQAPVRSPDWSVSQSDYGC